MSYQGTFDDRWKTQRLPYWPEDFDDRFHHSAPADLVAPDYLRGDELMILTNCLPNSRAIMLGDRQHYASITIKSGLNVIREGTGPYHPGDWCLEAALVVKLFGIDDSAFRKHPLYPAALVHRDPA